MIFGMKMSKMQGKIFEKPKQACITYKSKLQRGLHTAATISHNSYVIIDQNNELCTF